MSSRTTPATPALQLAFACGGVAAKPEYMCVGSCSYSKCSSSAVVVSSAVRLADLVSDLCLS